MHLNKQFFGDKLIISLNEQWSYFVTGGSWYDFTFIKAEAEYDPIFGNVSIELGLFGFCAYISVNINKPNEKGEEIIKQADSLIKSYKEGKTDEYEAIDGTVDTSQKTKE